MTGEESEDLEFAFFCKSTFKEFLYRHLQFASSLFLCVSQLEQQIRFIWDCSASRSLHQNV